MPSDGETRAQIASMLRRARLEEIDATGGQHMVRATGLRGEELRVPRVKDFGFSSSPPAGSIGLLASLGGRSDRAMLLGIDHADHGPRDLAGGHTAIYDAFGNVVSLVEKSVRIVAATKAEIVAPVVVVTSPDIRLGSASASQRVAIEGGYAQKVRAE